MCIYSFHLSVVMQCVLKIMNAENDFVLQSYHYARTYAQLHPHLLEDNPPSQRLVPVLMHPTQLKFLHTFGPSDGVFESSRITMLMYLLIASNRSKYDIPQENAEWCLVCYDSVLST